MIIVVENKSQEGLLDAYYGGIVLTQYPILSEFPDVFLKELHGLPPNCDLVLFVEPKAI